MMRICSSIVALALMTGAISAQSGWFNYQKNTKDSLYWHESSHKLMLNSGSGNGIEVKRVSPSSVWGLRQGDIILAIDGERVAHVEDMLKLLLSKNPTAVKMQLRDKGGERSIQVVAKDYMKIVLPTPPQ